MDTRILVAHTGQRLQVDSRQFSAIDELKEWVAQRSKVPAAHMVILSAGGSTIKQQSLHHERDICVYDLRLSQASSQDNPATSAVTEVPLPKPLSIPDAPDSIKQINDLSVWQGLFKERRNWADALVGAATRAVETFLERYDEMDVMVLCLGAAVSNTEISVKSLKPKYDELKSWSGPAIADYEQLVADWERHLMLARRVTISPSMADFMAHGGTQGNQPTLETLLDLDATRRAVKLAPAALGRLKTKCDDMHTAREDMISGLNTLWQELDKITGRSTESHSEEASALLRDIKAVSRKMDTDYMTTLGYTGSQIPQASRTAENHTERLIPSLRKRVREMDGMVKYATQARNKIAADTMEMMKGIAEVTALLSAVKSQLVALISADEDLATFDHLRLIHQIPYMYASFVAEAIRRKEWAEKVKTDSSTLANEMALFRDEEVKRRQKWYRTVGTTFGIEPKISVVGLEVNLLGEESPWPSMSRGDADIFLEQLQKFGADAVIIDDVRKLINDLSNPTRKQTKRIKAFKNGSVHEAALGRSGLLIRGDDDLVRSLRDDKSRLEDKLKTAESRVRRLEDLLHREQAAKLAAEQIARQGIGGLLRNPPSGQQAVGPGSVSSVNPPRFSADDHWRKSSDEASRLAQRVEQLEVQLRDEKQRAAMFEEHLSTRTNQHDTIRSQIEEANSTKRDLLGNMESLKREFVEERKALVEEIKGLKARLEDTEEEIEHFGESRENEKATYDEKVQVLEDELARLGRERKEENLKMQGQLDFLRSESRVQRDLDEGLEKDLLAAKEELRVAKSAAHNAAVESKAQLDALMGLHEQLSRGVFPPRDLGDLVEALGSRITSLINRVRSSEGDMAVVKSDLEQAQETVKSLRAEIEQWNKRVDTQEIANLHLRERLREEKAKIAALEEQLRSERSELSDVRVRMADGETGSETLRMQLEEGEKRITLVSEELAAKQSQVGGLEEEMRLLRERTDESQAKLGKLTARLDARTERAKDLTQRLYSQNDRLFRLLDRLGFSVTRQGSDMKIQRVPRAERSVANIVEGDLNASIRRSQMLVGRGLAESADLELLFWMKGSEPDAEERRYKEFLDSLGSFDTDLFAEIIYKRMKDVEHFARKLQRDGKTHAQRAQTLQKEAHEKIAFKHFKEGDLALFLPTRNQQSGAWAAFNVGFPHYFLRERDAHKLRSREWLVARISRIQERVVDLSKSLQQQRQQQRQQQQQQLGAQTSSLVDSVHTAGDDENDNPFQLSDGLRWYLIDAAEDGARGAAPSTPGAGKSTVAGSNIEAVAAIQTHPTTASTGGGRLLNNRGSIHSIEGVSRTLSRSLESRRSSGASNKRPLPPTGGLLKGSSGLASETNSLRAVAPDSPAGSASSANAGPASPLQDLHQPRIGELIMDPAAAAAGH